MLKIQFNPTDIDRLHYERFHHPHPLVQRKMEALWLKSQGLPHKEICRLVQISGNTLRSYLLSYEQGGIQGLKRLLYQGQPSVLHQPSETLEEYFPTHPPATMKEAMHKIEGLTGVRRSENRVRLYLKSLGMNRRRVGGIPAKADLEQQQLFKKKS